MPKATSAANANPARILYCVVDTRIVPVASSTTLLHEEAPRLRRRGALRAAERLDVDACQRLKLDQPLLSFDLGLGNHSTDRDQHPLAVDQVCKTSCTRRIGILRATHQLLGGRHHTPLVQLRLPFGIAHDV